jgi:hypothetical protein
MTKSETLPEPQEAVEKVSAETETHEGKPRKLDDLKLNEERRWGRAIRRFLDLKEEEELIGLIESQTDWPDEARVLFVDLVKGNVDRSNGRPEVWSGQLERTLLTTVFQKMQQGATSGSAISEVLEAYSAERDLWLRKETIEAPKFKNQARKLPYPPLTRDGIKTMISRAAKVGFNFSNWLKWNDLEDEGRNKRRKKVSE